MMASGDDGFGLIVCVVVLVSVSAKGSEAVEMVMALDAAAVELVGSRSSSKAN